MPVSTPIRSGPLSGSWIDEFTPDPRMTRFVDRGDQRVPDRIEQSSGYNVTAGYQYPSPCRPIAINRR